MFLILPMVTFKADAVWFILLFSISYHVTDLIVTRTWWMKLAKPIWHFDFDITWDNVYILSPTKSLIKLLISMPSPIKESCFSYQLMTLSKSLHLKYLNKCLTRNSNPLWQTCFSSKLMCSIHTQWKVFEDVMFIGLQEQLIKKLSAKIRDIKC